MELDGSGQFGVGFGWICQNLMAREQCERDLGGFCLGSVAHHWTIFIGLTAGKRHSCSAYIALKYVIAIEVGKRSDDK